MIKLKVIEAQSPACCYSGGSPILVLEDTVRCVRTEMGLRLVESLRAHDFNRLGEYVGTVVTHRLDGTPRRTLS